MLSNLGQVVVIRVVALSEHVRIEERQIQAMVLVEQLD